MIWEWLASPVDAKRVHDVGMALSWHARLMVLGWGVAAPLSILIVRFFKIVPWQDWPRELDNKIWWHSHWIIQSIVLILSAVALTFILASPQNTGQRITHKLFGYAVLVLGGGQAFSGLLRGSKGGPTDIRSDGGWHGDHYIMTTRRLIFEYFHKSFGYLTLILMIGAVMSGLWAANAPHWMWCVIFLLWGIISFFAIYLQRRGRAVDTYQAIWGPDPVHPGNRMKKQGWGTVRPRRNPKSHVGKGKNADV